MSSIRSILEELVDKTYNLSMETIGVYPIDVVIDQALLEIETKIVKAVGKMEPTNKFTINKDGSTNCTGQYDARARNRLRREISADIKKILK